MQKFFLALFLLITFAGFAQTKSEADSLLKLVDTNIPDSSKLAAYRRIGNYYMDNNAGKAIQYFLKVNELAKKLNLPLQVANSYYSMGFCYLVKSDYDKSLENYQQSIRIYETLKDTFRLTNALMSVGNVYNSNNNFQKLNEYYDLAEVLAEAKKDTAQLSSIYSERGNILNQQQQYEAGLTYQLKSLYLTRLIKDEYLTANTLINIGLTHKHLNHIQQSLAYYDSGFAILNATETPPDVWAAFYNNVAATNAKGKKYKEAKEAFAKSITYAIQTGSPAIEMENYRNMADMYGDINDYYLQSVYQKKYYTLKDSLFSTDNKNQLTQLEADYQVEKKNAEIVKKDAEVVKQKNQRNIFMIVAAAVFLVLASLFYFYRRIQQNNRLLERKNEQIEQQKNELQTLNQVKDRLFSIISHDLRNPLVTLKSYLTLSSNTSLSFEKKEQFKQQTFRAVTQTGDMLDNLLAWANMQLKNTAPSITITDYSNLIQDVVSEVQAQALLKTIRINTNIEVNDAPGNELIISIALRNLLTNAIKFSKEQSEIEVRSFLKDNMVCLSVKDQGLGMSVEQIQQLNSNSIDTTKGTAGEKGSGMGLFLVKELLEKINGKLVIESEPNKGSTVTIQLPANTLF